MSRLIDADVLEPDADYDDGDYWAVSIAQIQNAPTIVLHEPQRWIPCSERLPEKAGHYLCSFETPRRIDNIYVDVAYWTGGMWYGVGKIIAWMPLPEPYKEDNP